MKKVLLSLLMLALAMPAFAFNIPMADGMKLNMYGQVRMTAAYEGSNVSNGLSNATAADFKMKWQGNSRFGINFSAGNFFANAEMKVTPDAVGSAGFRQFWGGYKMDNGLTIIAGNKTTLSGIQGISNDVYFVDNGLVGFGTAGDTRRPLIMLSYAGVDFSLVANGPDHGALGAYAAGEDYIPRFEVAYNLKLENTAAKFVASYGLYTHKYTKGGATMPTSYINVNAFHVGANVKQTFGNMYVGAAAFYSMNGGMYGAVKMINNAGNDVTNIKPTIAMKADGEAEVLDVNTFGGALVFGMNLSDTLGVEVGGGYQLSSSDQWNDEDVTGYAAYVNAPLKLFEGHFVVTPQVGYYGRSTDANLGGATSVEALIAGAQVKVVF